MNEKSQPIFVDLNGHTARVDPQRSITAYMRLSVTMEQVYSEETGEIIHRPQAVELYITADQADALADALRKGRKQL